ncbi:hypothetical protein GCM10011428_71800 [Streptomyces violaceus]
MALGDRPRDAAVMSAPYRRGLPVHGLLDVPVAGRRWRRVDRVTGAHRNYLFTVKPLED